jgi:hypothetical protein
MTIPVNMNTHTFGTVAFWKSAAPHYGVRTWRSAAKRFAQQHGKAIVMHADDSATIMERDSEQGTIRQHRLPKENVRWFRA